MSAGQVVALLGPTGVGKTQVAVELARRLGARVVSCDSMQVYRGFEVLTNQPRTAEDDPGLHELTGFLDAERCISAGEYAALARPLIQGLLGRHGRAVVAGGSGLYMRAALAPLAATPAADAGLRERLEERARVEGGEAMHSELAALDPEAAAAIDPRNIRRVVRALESIDVSDRRWSGRSDLWEPAYDHPTLVVGLQCDRSRLAGRILTRTERMLRDGAMEEIKRFREERADEVTRPGLPGIRSAIGYGEICQHLAGELTLAQTTEQMAAATRRYARRQDTWLRKVKGAVMIDVSDRHAADVAAEIAALAEQRHK